MKITKLQISLIKFVLPITAIILLGIFLRLCQLKGQIIGDDEWHAINVATKANFKYIFTHFHGSDNCIPLTAIYKLMLDTIGLNEWNLHALQLILGILCIPAFSIIVYPLLKPGAVLIFTFLIATSPLLIYYSRYARPYGVSTSGKAGGLKPCEPLKAVVNLWAT